MEVEWETLRVCVLVMKIFRDTEVQWTAMGKLYFSRAE